MCAVSQSEQTSICNLMAVHLSSLFSSSHVLLHYRISRLAYIFQGQRSRYLVMSFLMFTSVDKVYVLSFSLYHI